MLIIIASSPGPVPVLDILFLQIFTLVIFLFTAGQCNFKLGITAFGNKYFKGYNGQSFFLYIFLQAFFNSLRVSSSFRSRLGK